MSYQRALLVVVLVHLVRCVEENAIDPVPDIYEPSWVYKCVPDEGCQRSEHPGSGVNAGKNSSNHFDSLSVCRTVCGRFGGLWPKPVTAALSSQTVNIHPNYLRIHFGECAMELHELIPPSPLGRGTRRRLGFHPYVVDLPAIRTKKFASSFIMRTAKEWNALPADLFPEQYNLGLFKARVNRHFSRFDLLDVPAEVRSLLISMTHVVTKNLLAECHGNVTEIVDTPVVVYITVKSNNIALTWDTDEQYMLDVQSKEGTVAVHVVAETVYGARHALETFSQLVAPDTQDFAYKYTCGLRLVAGAKIRDRPVYKHRGLLLDTSRNFLPIEDIKRSIDGMAAVKMNAFHWHVTDSHSFPFESTRVPQFTRYGAYSSVEIYTTEDVEELMKYAQVQGIRVVIEIDAPAHAGNGWQWGKEYGLGDLAVCVNAAPWRPFCIQPPCGQLNPANDQMYRVLRDLYRDIAEVLPKPALLHMGGDEVFFNCWNSSEEIRNYMTEQGYPITTEGFIDLWGEFHKKALKSWDEELVKGGWEDNQPVMLWSSDLTQANRIKKYLDQNRYVIEVWEPLNSPLLVQLMSIGYKTVSIPKDIWYLDHGFWGRTQFSNWRRMYSHMLPKHNNMLGGEVAMWGEYVDAQALDTRVWPRAAAVAERLWSDPVSGPNAAEPRLQRMRERLVSRGLRPDVISPAWCAQHDSKCT